MAVITRAALVAPSGLMLSLRGLEGFSDRAVT